VTEIVVSRTGDTKAEMRLATREDTVKTKSRYGWEYKYNKGMSCHVKDELVSQLIALNDKLNLLSPDHIHGDEERAEVQQLRETLYAEIKHHRAKRHEGKPCPAASKSKPASNLK
jgi:hypothetical protein